MTILDVQKFLSIPETGIIDEFTEAAIRNFQIRVELNPTGLVDEPTIKRIKEWMEGHLDTDFSTKLGIKQYYLNKDEYYKTSEKKQSVFIHHTAGWNNPYYVVQDWERDTRGKVGTAYVIGGINPSTNDKKYDGDVLECMPPYTSYAWHLGIGNNSVHRTSVGIELCNFGWLNRVNNKYLTWANKEVHPDNVIKLDKPFRGYEYFVKYSDSQLVNLRALLIQISKQTGIDITLGLQKRIKTFKDAHKAFDYDPSVVKSANGLFTHTNVSGPNKWGKFEKWDCFPQPELIDMILTL